MTTKAATSRRLTRYLAGPALALGVAIGSAGVANAVWDIGAYDRCTSRIPDSVPVENTDDYFHECCLKSGGIWTKKNTANQAGGTCVAPPAEAGRNPFPHVMQPSPLPAPPGDIGTAPGQVG